MTGMAWFCFGAWCVTSVLLAYALIRWHETIDLLQRLRGENEYLRGELLDVHGRSDWEW